MKTENTLDTNTDWIISTFFCSTSDRDTDEDEAAAEEISDTRHNYKFCGTRTEAEAVFGKVVDAFQEFQSKLASLDLVFSNGLLVEQEYCLPSVHMSPSGEPANIVLDY